MGVACFENWPSEYSGQQQQQQQQQQQYAIATTSSRITNMKGYSKPNGAANRRCHMDHVHGGNGILLFVLTALTLTSLITPTEQLTAATPIPATAAAAATPSSNMKQAANDGAASFNAALEQSERYKHMNANLPCEYCERPDGFSIKLTAMILYALVCIVGLFGNTLVIYVVLRFSKMQTVTNIYILNLAIADECFLIGIPILIYTMQVGGWNFGTYMCKAFMVSTSITQFTSSIFLLIMSADRYIAVCHPLSSPRYRTPFVSKVVSAGAWMMSVLLMLPCSYLFASTVELENGNLSCNMKWPESFNVQSDSAFILYSLVLGFATPLLFILIFYCLVIRKLHTVGPKHKSKEKKRSHRKVTKLVLTVITVYILCWLPHWISQVALINSTPSCTTKLELAIFLVCGCLSYSNSAMNPILYAFLSDNFKKSFMKACTCAARKDVNAQLQLENSFFPKFGKGRQSERLIAAGKGKRKGLAANRNNNAPMTTTTTTTTADVAPTGTTSCSAALLVVNAETNNCKPPVLHTDL
ncbi:LOW QUALITY PROTEIN: somatostatin receptor type 5 [Drosophila busckii]|uniref:LOW QUALITY PROTEIN: somatostatin receptor type 5 n=1 Tax=Drosophila busckii TaxID=30019 RepID=UPI0014330CC0|nr:LOW QUALITY PROTEIN: somatostatin receptor type 5 [Drosophila busckii]